jgi:UPF0755 protein
MLPEEIPEKTFTITTPRVGKRLIRFFFALLILFIGASVGLYFMSMPPKDFPSDTLIEIPSGMSVIKAGQMLEEMNVVRSAVIFQTLVIVFSSDKGVRSGYYLFDYPQSVISIAEKLSFGKYGISRSKITLPEGSSSMEMADIFSAALPRMNKDAFLEMARKREGYLFPETYYFFETATADEIVQMLTNEFQTKLEPLLEDIAASGHSEKDIITMASIIEKESNGRNGDQEMISGILWNRLKRNMRLQVDATYLYANEEVKYGFSTQDVKNDTSAYNTYKNDGLPPGPIGNPGLRSIKAAIKPTKNDYLFYIHDRAGNAHYAKTYSEHQANIAAYLQ